MKKILLSATMLSMLAGAAFAGQPQIAAGDINIAQTSAASTAGVMSEQGTSASVRGMGVAGVVSGNYTDVNTAAAATAGPKGSETQTSAQQLNVGGTIAGSIGFGAKATGGQTSAASGTASATAKNLNVGGFIAMPKQGRPHVE